MGQQKKWLSKAMDAWHICRLAIGFERDAIATKFDRRLVEDSIEQEKPWSKAFRPYFPDPDFKERPGNASASVNW